MLPYAATLFLLTAAGPCADLSGRYVMQAEDNRVFVSIVQPLSDIRDAVLVIMLPCTFSVCRCSLSCPVCP